MAQPDKGAVIVTGASRGIGAAVARALAEAGHPVVVNCAASIEQAQDVADGIIADGGKALAVVADVADEAAVAAMVDATVKEFGVLAGVVNNASPSIETVDFLDLDWAAMQRHLDVQVKGAFTLCRQALPHMLASGQGGCVVNVASVAARNLPPAKQTPYVVAKAALAQLTRCLAVEFGPKGVRVNSVSPGMTDTDLIAGFPEKARMVNAMQAPLRRLAEPADIAGAVAFLFSPGAGHITGVDLPVCGGIVMG